MSSAIVASAVIWAVAASFFFASATFILSVSSPLTIEVCDAMDARDDNDRRIECLAVRMRGS